MPGSALIFLLIIAIWAAYLAQSWARFHEHAATARNVDKFSTAMRVLERRAPLPQVEAVEERAGQRVLPRPAAPEVRVNPTPRPSLGASARALPRPHNPAMPSPRQIRAGLLLTSFLATVGLTVATLTLGLTWVAPTVAGVVLVGTLAWGVQAGRAAQQRARLERQARIRASRPMPSKQHPQAGGARRAADRSTGTEVPAAEDRSVESVAVPPARPTPARRARPELFDIEAPRDVSRATRPAEAADVAPVAPAEAAGVVPVAPAEAAATAPVAPVECSSADSGPADAEAPGMTAAPGAPAPAEAPHVVTAADGTPVPRVLDLDETGWQPTPVPRPTYTMKAKAERRPVPVADLPFDGNAMVLDVEDEELPAVYKIG